MSDVHCTTKLASFKETLSCAIGVKNLYSISFTDNDPVTHNKAQALLSVLVDSNLGNQRRDADDVKSFLDAQIGWL